MRSDNGAELFPVVDEAGNVMGAATRAQCHGGGMLLHPVVHLHLFNSRGELYLQRRPVWKDIQPGRWDTAVGGHVDYGETVDDALRREVREELGVTGFVPERVAVYVFRSEREREWSMSIVRCTTGRLRRATNWTAGGSGAGPRCWKTSARVFTPNFEGEAKLILNNRFISYLLNREAAVRQRQCGGAGSCRVLLIVPHSCCIRAVSGRAAGEGDVGGTYADGCGTAVSHLFVKRRPRNHFSRTGLI
ncbi:MAG: NUDIX hydrolase [Alistipes sp.]